MKEKRKCLKCNLLIDSDMEYCPYCGYKQESEEENKETKEKIKKEVGNTTKHSSLRGNFNLFSFEEMDVKIHIIKQIFLFVTGWIGIKIISLILQELCLSYSELVLQTVEGSAFLNFSIYLILFGILSLITLSDYKHLFNGFKHIKDWIINIGYGGALIVFSYIVNVFFKLVGMALGVKVTDNNNENSIDAIVNLYPFLSILIFGVIGPVCEELTYRLGLFSLIKKGNRIAAYVCTALIFGSIHFDFDCLASGNIMLIANEFLAIPSYIAAGLFLCFIYEKRGISGSVIAHCTNNLLSIILTIIAKYL